MTRTLSIHPTPEAAARSAAERSDAWVEENGKGSTPERRWAVLAPTAKKGG